MAEIHYTEVKNWHWPNFTPKEIACKQISSKGNCGCGGKILIDPFSMDCLVFFRKIVGVPVFINSAYRCEIHNRNVGGAKESQHRLCKAFDIRITNALSRETIHKAAKKSGFKGIGDYDNFVHIDTREKPSYWDDRK